MDAMSYYGFIETARRKKAGRTVKEHRDYMAALIAPMSERAASNPFSMFKHEFSAEKIAAPTAANRNLISPFLKHMVAKDGVNQGAAIVAKDGVNQGAAIVNGYSCAAMPKRKKSSCWTVLTSRVVSRWTLSLRGL